MAETTPRTSGSGGLAFAVSWTGYDATLVARLDAEAQCFFRRVCALALGAACVIGIGMAHGAALAFSLPVACVLGFAFAGLTLNLYRLLHAGTGYPMHRPIEEIDGWRPGFAPVVVLAALGGLVVQPLVFVAIRPFIHDSQLVYGGLVTRAHAAWSHPWAVLPLTCLAALCVGAPAWLRIVRPVPVRAYERERWIEGRLLVDDAYAGAQEAITRLLDGKPGFRGRLALHAADPPYNTRPLIHGIDPLRVEHGQVRFRSLEDAQSPETPSSDSETVLPPGTSARSTKSRSFDTERSPPVAPSGTKTAVAKTSAHGVLPADQGTSPLSVVTPHARGPAAPPPVPETHARDDVGLSWDDDAPDIDEGPPQLGFLDVGRLSVHRARTHIDIVAPFLANLTGRSETDVRGFLRTAPDDERVHRLFSDYKKLHVILLKDADFALAHGLGPVVSVIVQRPLEDVMRRLRAAPPHKRLTGVFAPELARRLLKKASVPEMKHHSVGHLR